LPSLYTDFRRGSISWFIDKQDLSGNLMDIVFIGAIAAFFVLVAAMAAGCDMLGGQQ